MHSTCRPCHSQSFRIGYCSFPVGFYLLVKCSTSRLSILHIQLFPPEACRSQIRRRLNGSLVLQALRPDKSQAWGLYQLCMSQHTLHVASCCKLLQRAFLVQGVT